jgi:GGDEF domain-containing protein
MLHRLRRALPEGQTCSAGVCLWDGEESAEKLTARADTGLYAAKAAGRDTVVSA